MANLFTIYKNYQDIADAIREMLNSNESMTPSEMPDNIRSISGGSVTVDNELSLESENPVQNKVISSVLMGIAELLAAEEDTFWTSFSATGDAQANNEEELEELGIEIIYLPHSNTDYADSFNSIADAIKENQNIPLVIFRFKKPNSSTLDLNAVCVNQNSCSLYSMGEVVFEDYTVSDYAIQVYEPNSEYAETPTGFDYMNSSNNEIEFDFIDNSEASSGGIK